MLKNLCSLAVITLTVVFAIILITYTNRYYDTLTRRINSGKFINSNGDSSTSRVRGFNSFNSSILYYPINTSNKNDSQVIKDSYNYYYSGFNENRLAPLTKQVQAWIHEKLYNSSLIHECRNKRYLVIGNHRGGLGSIINVATAMLGAALEHDYIPVWHPDWEGAGALFTDKVGCDGGKYHNFLCYFEPLSVCGYEYVTKENSHFTDSADPPFGFKTDDVPSFWRDRLTEFHRNQNGGGDIGLTRAYFKFWWRAQGSAYIMRLNGATRSKLLQMRLDTKYNEGIVVGDSSSGTNVTVPFPLPSGTINAHVRHGDKGSEMKLIPLQDYIIAAERFVSENPLSYKPILFLSTEDQECIDQAHSLGFTIKTQPASKWIVFWSNINRGNTSPYAQLEKFGRSKMMFEWLLQLWMALECDVFIGTLGSNWNRLIAQLRCTMVDKCQNPYFEVGTGESWVDYNW